jgi:hypothetical protein
LTAEEKIMAADTMKLQFIPVHIEPFEKDGEWFARCLEFDVIAHGDSEIHAARNLFNMVSRSVFAAQIIGNLEAVLKGAGVEIVAGVPQEQASSGRDAPWYLPLTTHARPSFAS